MSESILSQGLTSLYNRVVKSSIRGTVAVDIWIGLIDLDRCRGNLSRIVTKLTFITAKGDPVQVLESGENPIRFEVA